MLAVLVASLLSFAYLQQQNESLDQARMDEVECVEESAQAPEVIFSHLALLKQVAETGKKLLSIRF